MTEAPSSAAIPIEERLIALQNRGAKQHDPVGWHYLQTLAERSSASSGQAQALLHHKLHQTIDAFQAQMQTARAHCTGSSATPSPLATLLNDIAQHHPSTPGGKPSNGHAESTRVQLFRQQLGKIRVQKQVSQAIAQAPQNAGPINSHMLVLRSLGLMRDISPDYLNRFMGYIDTLLCLDEAALGKTTPKKTFYNKAEK